MDKTERALDVQIVHLRTYLSEDNEVALLFLLNVGHNEVLDAGLTGSAVKIKHIGFRLFAPFSCLAHAFLNQMPVFAALVAIAQVFEWKLCLREVDEELPWPRKTKNIGLIAYGGSAGLGLVLEESILIAEEV